MPGCSKIKVRYSLIEAILVQVLVCDENRCGFEAYHHDFVLEASFEAKLALYE